MITLNCPSCGGELGLPDELSIAHCMFCGAKILLDEYKNNNQVSSENLIELVDSAIKAGNFDEALSFCNKALTINPKNPDLWFSKALSIFNLYPLDTSRKEEAIIYLEKAEDLALNNEKFKNRESSYIEVKASIFSDIGKRKFKEAERMEDDLLSCSISDYDSIKNRQRNLYKEAMENFDFAIKYSSKEMDVHKYKYKIQKKIKTQY